MLIDLTKSWLVIETRHDAAETTKPTAGCKRCGKWQAKLDSVLLRIKMTCIAAFVCVHITIIMPYVIRVLLYSFFLNIIVHVGPIIIHNHAIDYWQ